MLAACSTASHKGRVSVLLVGDSLITQSAKAWLVFPPSGADLTVAEASGSAPCDWERGFYDPFEKGYKSFAQELERVKPRYVILMFTGNPGLSGPAAGCVDASRPYSLAQVQASYRQALVAMAKQASAVGAWVYFERSPPRNPAVPVGSSPASHVEWGYQGLPALATTLQRIATSAPAGDHWVYIAGGATAVAGPSFSYVLELPCSFLAGRKECRAGRVPVRAGGDDAMHFDQPGCGAVFFALGTESDLPTGPLNPGAVRDDLGKYPYCP